MKKILCILSLLFSVYTTANAQLLRSVLKKQPQKTVTNRSQNNDDGLLINRSSAGHYSITPNNNTNTQYNSSGQNFNRQGQDNRLNIEKSSAGEAPIISSPQYTTTNDYNSDNSSTQKSRLCSVCNGKGYYVSEQSNAAVAGKRKWCNECNREVYLLHTHKHCDTCRGQGYIYE